MKERFMKNDVFSLEYDKETLKDMVLELQEENNQLKCNWNKLKEYLNYKSERAVGEDEYVYDEIYNEMQELEQENARLKEIENKLNFIKNRKNQGASQENINKMAIEFVNSYLKEVE